MGSPTEWQASFMARKNPRPKLEKKDLIFILMSVKTVKVQYLVQFVAIISKLLRNPRAGIDKGRMNTIHFGRFSYIFGPGFVGKLLNDFLIFFRPVAEVQIRAY